MFYDSVTNLVMNGYEYWWDLAGFGLDRHDTVTNTTMCNNIFGNAAIKRISQELVKCTPNAYTNQARINSNS